MTESVWNAQKMDFLRKRADYIIDTSHLLTRELRQEIEKIFVNNEKFCNMMVTVLSFGFKYGIPADADWYSMCVFFRIHIMRMNYVPLPVWMRACLIM